MVNITNQTAVVCQGLKYFCTNKTSLTVMTNSHRYNGFVKLLAAISFIAMTFFTVVGNSLVILVILRKSKFQTPSNLFIVSLAITHILVGLITIPMRGLYETANDDSCHYGVPVCAFETIISDLTLYSSMLHLIVIAVDKYLTETMIQYRTARTNSWTLVLVGMVYILAFWLSAVPVLVSKDPKHVLHVYLPSNDLTINLKVFIGIFIAPSLAIFVLYTRIFCLTKDVQTHRSSCGSDVMELSKRRESESKTNQGGIEATTNSNTHRTDEECDNTDKKNREDHVFKLLSVITCFTYICWLPFFLYFTLYIFGKRLNHNTVMAFKITFWIGYLNSLFFPLLCAFLNPFYGQELRTLLGMN